MSNIISFCLYGTQGLREKKRNFLQGLLVNIHYARLLYPEWICRVYLPPSEPTHILRIVQAIPNLQVRIVPYMIPGRTLRFLVNDDPDVDMYLSRDLDSVVNDKERKAVQEWIHSGKSLHLMHDSHQHVQAIQGGMFGVRKPFKMNMLHKLQSTFSSSQERWGTDITFLTNHLLPHYIKSNDNP